MSTTDIPPLHQSIAKELLRWPPAIARAKWEGERKSTRTMERGTLVDQLVFGGAKFEVISSTYKSGPRKGQPVEDMAGGDMKALAADVRSRGFTPCLQHELDSAMALAGAIKARMIEAGIPLEQCIAQRSISWTTPLGCPAQGTPDLTLGVDTIDAKVGHTADPDRLDQHVGDQGWHIQGAAYQEGIAASLGYQAIGRGKHWIVAAETESGIDCVTVCPLDPLYLTIGLQQWEAAQRIWMSCWRTNSWPEYAPRPITPSQRVLWKAGMA
jgi:hypothetical protein